jgi:trimeric autotransporter adhesin
LLACFALSPAARAVSPPPDGGYPGQNTAEGDSALFSLTSGTSNTAIGFDALFNNTTGDNNTAIGFEALLNDITGFQNTATGFGALARNTTGSDNTANGVLALALNTTGTRNTAVGGFALGDNTRGFGNTASGFEALESNRTGDFNTASGFEALLSNTTGRNNTATGFEALAINTTGDNNTAIGQRSLSGNTSGNFNIAVGPNAGEALTTGSNNIDISNPGMASESDTIRIGMKGTHKDTFIAGIFGTTVAEGVPVVIGRQGHLGTTTSSACFKQSITPMEKTSESIYALQPVTFTYKPELDPDRIPQFGLIAEQVEKVNPHLVTRDTDGKVNTVRYEAVNAMLLNEFLKEHRKNEQQESKIEHHEAKIARQQQQIEALTAGLQKVSAQLGMSKAAPQTVLNNR